MTTFFLIRHGETDWSLNEKYSLKGEYRDLPPLTLTGVEQAKKLCKDPKLRKAELILSSPYTRALQTAAILSRNMNLEIIIELDLREWQPDLNLEITNQMELKEAIDGYEKENSERENGIYPINIFKPWESKASLKNRVENVLEKYTDYNYIIVVTHEQVIKTWVNAEEIAYCSINELEII